MRRPRSCSTRSRPRTSKSRSTDSFDRDVSEDASVGAYIALVDGERLENAREAGARGARDRLPHAAVGAGRFAPHLRHGRARPDRRGRRLHLPRPADAGLLRQAGHRQPGEVRQDAAAAVLRRADGLRRRGQHRLRLPRTSGRPVLSQVARRPAVLQALRREHLPQRPLQRRRRPRRSPDPRRSGRGGAEACGAGLRRRQDLLRPERHQHLEQGRHERRAAARRPRPVRPQQPQVAAPGRAGPGRRDPDLPADGAQSRSA